MIRKWLILEAIGTTWSILLGWDDTLFTCKDYCIANHSINAVFENVKDGFSWCLTTVYGHYDDPMKNNLWNELESVC